MYTTIIVPTDRSSAAAKALPVAADIARRCGARLHLVMVHDPSMFIPFMPGEVAVPVYDAEVVSAERAEAEAEVESQAAQLRSEGIDAVGTVLEGTVVETIAEHALEIGAQLTVMSTHGRTGFNRLRLGSVANSYVTRTSTPTLLIRAREEAVAPTLAGGTLLVTLDGSPFAEQILPHATLFARSLGMRLELVSVTQPAAIPMAPFGTEALLADPRDLAIQEESRDGYLQKVAGSLGAGTTTRVITDMSAGGAIVEAARDDSVSAVAIATHGRGGLMRLVLGSVANEVLQNVDVPVLVYRPDSK